MPIDKDLLIPILAGLLSVVWYFLRTQDTRQQKSIDLLFKKHDDDAKELEALKLHVAGEHYKRGELDQKFDKLEVTVREGLSGLASKLDKLTDVMIEKGPR